MMKYFEFDALESRQQFIKRYHNNNDLINSSNKNNVDDDDGERRETENKQILNDFAEIEKLKNIKTGERVTITSVVNNNNDEDDDYNKILNKIKKEATTTSAQTTTTTTMTTINKIDKKQNEMDLKELESLLASNDDDKNKKISKLNDKKELESNPTETNPAPSIDDWLNDVIID